MSLTRIALLAALVLPSLGCVAERGDNGVQAANVIDDHLGVFLVPAEFSPLAAITERPDYVLPESAITTIGTTAYVVNLSAWLRQYRPGSFEFHAVMLHEQAHSKRQLAYGTLGWIAHYVVDTDFMWTEEQIGWYYELIMLRNSGVTINADGVATILSHYKNATNSRMVGFVEAKQWVQSVLSGQWKPQ